MRIYILGNKPIFVGWMGRRGPGDRACDVPMSAMIANESYIESA